MFHWPKTRTEWWRQKISANRAHDEAMQDNAALVAAADEGAAAFTLDLLAVRQTARDRLAVTARASTASKDGQAANDEDFAEVKTVGRPRWTRGF